MNKSSAVPTQSISTISLLTRSGRLSEYTGLRPDIPRPVSNKERYLNLLRERAPPDMKATIIEIHSGEPIVRRRKVNNMNDDVKVKKEPRLPPTSLSMPPPPSRKTQTKRRLSYS